MTAVHIKRRNLGADTYTGTVRKDEGRGEGDELDQGIPRVAADYQTIRRSMEYTLSHGSQKEPKLLIA